MTKVTSNPSLQEVLNAFAVEASFGEETLDNYLRRFPQFAAPLIDLSLELERELPTYSGIDNPEVTDRIDAAWRTHEAALGEFQAVDAFENLSTDQLRIISKELDVPRQVLTAFRDKRVLASSVPQPFLSRLVAAVKRASESAVQSLSPPVQFARSYKADKKPDSGVPVSLEQILIDAGVSEQRRKQLLARVD